MYQAYSVSRKPGHIQAAASPTTFVRVTDFELYPFILTFLLVITTETAPAAAASAIPSPSQPQAGASSPPSPSFPSLPYHVHRTASQELPIYHLAKRGGNLHQTRIRKIEGDRVKLRDELQESLGLKKENAVINQVTGQIVLKVCDPSRISEGRAAG